MNRYTRRQFMKSAMIVSAGVTGFPMVFIPKSQASMTDKILVHPNVDNLKVVAVTDNGMIKGNKPSLSWSRQDELVVPEMVWNNIDKLASRLTDVNDPESAWKTIFIKPPEKSWQDTVIAIKTNNLGQQHTHSAVMAKICNTLTDIVGVRSRNIYIYDASHGRKMRKSQAKPPFLCPLST